MPDEQFHNSGGVPDRKEILHIMKDGGIKLCDYALTQWIGNKYTPYPYGEGDEEMRAENIQRWNYIKEQIKIIAREA